MLDPLKINYADELKNLISKKDQVKEILIFKTNVKTINNNQISLLKYLKKICIIENLEL